MRLKQLLHATDILCILVSVRLELDLYSTASRTCLYALPLPVHRRWSPLASCQPDTSSALQDHEYGLVYHRIWCDHHRFSLSSLLYGQTAVKLSGAEDANRAQCAAPDKPVGYWNLLVVFANLKRVIQCVCFKPLSSSKGTPKCNLRILAVAQHLPRKWRLVSSSCLQRGHTGR